MEEDKERKPSGCRGRSRVHSIHSGKQKTQGSSQLFFALPGAVQGGEPLAFKCGHERLRDLFFFFAFVFWVFEAGSCFVA
jgi:hypothetical protein